MDIATQSVIISILLVLLLGSSIWIGVSLTVTGLIAMVMFLEIPTSSVLGNIFWNSVNSSTMFALPLFILMGELLFRSQISANLFKGVAPLVDKLPGRLIHVNVWASTLFAAVSGSSAATTATVGRMTLPEFDQRGYDVQICVGSLAAAGSLGFLIPPSMMMLVYAITADVSVGKLFVAGIIPGILMASLFSSYIIIACLINPQIAPREKRRFTWEDRLRALPMILPVISLIGLVLGSIYLGWATPTESAAVGVAGSLLLMFWDRSFSFEIFKTAIMQTVKTSCMIILIIAGASYLSVVIGYLNIPANLAAWIRTFNMHPYMLITVLAAMYIFLGCFIDGFAMIVMTLPIVLPMIQDAGFDKLWFGIFLTIMIQIANFTPPVGFNLFVINGLTDISIWKIAKGAVPFFVLTLLLVTFLVVWPDVVMYLPQVMIGK